MTKIAKQVFPIVLLFGCALPACSRADAAAEPQGRKAEVTPAMESKANEILRANADAPIGSEHPFTLEGKRYVGRIEEHENSSGNPNRPPGKHRGVTVYVAD